VTRLAQPVHALPREEETPLELLDEVPVAAGQGANAWPCTRMG
jgi:hypothetical protein